MFTAPIEYTTGNERLEGFIAYDEKKKTPLPAILIVPDWMGIGQFTKNKAEELAKKGYVAFVVDMYGKGIRPKNTDEAGKLITKYINDRKLMRKHIRAAFDKVISLEQVNKNKVVAIGYCFGGTTVLELARSGAPVIGTVTFHGGLSTPTPEDAKNIKGAVLVLHGADDPHVPDEQVKQFKEEMKDVNMEFVAYPDAMHSFTNPTANDKSKGLLYDAQADKKSWAAFEHFLEKIG